jgi:lipopolysaccharide/colanic/teichoic acid biosynthesis glycosyltransferase
VTGVGRFIRKHSIDEIPQFVNCWLGHVHVRAETTLFAGS